MPSHNVRQELTVYRPSVYTCRGTAIAAPAHLRPPPCLSLPRCPLLLPSSRGGSTELQGVRIERGGCGGTAPAGCRTLEGPPA